MDEIKNRLKGMLSRKFLAFAVATVALFMGKLTAVVWAGIAAAYMASNIVQKITEEKL